MQDLLEPPIEEIGALPIADFMEGGESKRRGEAVRGGVAMLYYRRQIG